MIIILLPDPLIWQAGISYGLHALAELDPARTPYLCYLQDDGPQLEEVGYLVHLLGLRKRVRFVSKPLRYLRRSHVVLLPRVRSLDRAVVASARGTGKKVITSDPQVGPEDPNLLVFPRRDWKEAAAALLATSSGYERA